MAHTVELAETLPTARVALVLCTEHKLESEPVVPQSEELPRYSLHHHTKYQEAKVCMSQRWRSLVAHSCLPDCRVGCTAGQVGKLHCCLPQMVQHRMSALSGKLEQSSPDGCLVGCRASQAAGYRLEIAPQMALDKFLMRPEAVLRSVQLEWELSALPEAEDKA